MNWRPEGWEQIKVKEDCLLFEAGADAMLEAACKEIEKVENPYPLDMLESEIWELCRQKILEIMSSKEV